MTPKSDTSEHMPQKHFPTPAAADIRCKQERDEALEWVSHNALLSVKNTWCKARLHERRTK